MKKMLLIILSIVTMHIHTMELAIEKKNYIPWYAIYKVSAFRTLPAEILDYIASFLTFDDFEDEQEFIERTKMLTIEETPAKYQNHSCEHISAYSSDNTSIGILKKHQSWPTTLTIIDTKNDEIVYSEKLYTAYKIAISRDKNMFAYIHFEFDDSFSICDVMRHTTVVSIKNIISKNVESHEIRSSFSISYPHGFDHPTIAFNKEGTYIILHGNDYWQREELNLSANQVAENPIRHHMILPLTVNTPDPNADYKKTLLKYLKQRNVFEESTKKITLIK